MVTIVARQAAAKTKVVAIWMIITAALLRFGYRSVAISAALGMSLESRDNTGRSNLSGLPWQLLSRGDPSYRHSPHCKLHQIPSSANSLAAASSIKCPCSTHLTPAATACRIARDVVRSRARSTER
jgi:hypothetical protein